MESNPSRVVHGDDSEIQISIQAETQGDSPTDPSRVVYGDDSEIQISIQAETHGDSPTDPGDSPTDPGDSPTEMRCMDPQLYKAAAGGKTSDLSHILPKFGDLINEVTPMANTVLHIAAQFGNQKCVSLILEHDSGLSLLQLCNKHGETPLHLAAREGYLEVVKALIECRAQFHEEMLRMTNQEGDTALHEAVRYRHPQVVKLLIEEDPELTHGPNKKGNTPLYMAAERGFDDLVNIILDNSPTSNHRGPMGRTALHAAVISEHPEMVQKILEWKEGVIREVDYNGWSPLHCAAYLGYTSIVRQLLDKSKHVNQVIYLQIQDDSKKTALHIAASRGHIGIAKLLASYNPDCCEQVDGKGNNAIHLLMSQKHYFLKLFCVPWFRTRGLINGKNHMGQTPLHLLADFQMDHGTDFIMSQRVDKMALNDDGLTVTDMLSSANDPLGRQTSILRELKSVKARAGPLGWQKANETLEGENDMKGSKDNGVSRSTGSGDEDIISATKKKGENHLIVVALIATITFAAGFTLPGGYKDDGMAVLTKKTSFKIFVVADTTALVLSMSAICVYFFMVLNNHKQVLEDLLRWGLILTMYAMGGTMIAFMMGLYIVLSDSAWLEVCICSICGCFFIFFCYLLTKFYSSWKILVRSSFWCRKLKLFVIERQQLPLMRRGNHLC